MTSSIDVRPLEESEADDYLAFVHQLDRDTRFLLWEPGERTLTAHEIRTRLQEVFARDRRMTFVAVEDGNIVGFLAAIRGFPRRIRHKADFAMGLLEHARGRGIGGRLIDAVEGWARDLGLTRLELTVMAHNETAIRLYEKKGFVNEGIKRASIVVDDVPVDEIIMGKVFTPGI